MTMGARSARPAPPPEKDPAYDGRRDNDRRGFYGWAFVENLAWPVAFLAAVMLLAITAVYILHGQSRVEEFIRFLQGPVVLSLLGAVTAAGIKVIASVPHTARLERRQAETQAGVAEATEAATASAARVDTIARFAERLDGKVDRLEERLTELTRVAGSGGGPGDSAHLEAIESRIEDRLTALQDLVVAHGAQLGRAVISLTTGELRAQSLSAVREAALNRGRMPLYAPSGEPGSSRVTPEATPARTTSPGPDPRVGRAAPVDPLDTAFPHHRDATAQQPALPPPSRPPVAADEDEDWQPADHEDLAEGPGLPTGIRQDFRDAMRAAQQGDLDEQLAPPPTREPVEPEVIRRAREQARARDELRRRWTDPEEGPR